MPCNIKINPQELLIAIIKESLVELALDKFSGELQYMDIPAESSFGDYTSNVALRLSRVVGKPPSEIATVIVEAIKKRLEKYRLKDYIKEIRIEGPGFINFYFNDSFFYVQLKNIIWDGINFIKANLGQGKRVLIEFVSANPTGPLSVAHARQAVVGDVLANILKFLGFKVKREYYLNDEGNQVDILGKSIELRLAELSGVLPEFPQNYYQGEYIYDIAKKVKSKKVKVKNFSEFGISYILDIIKKELTDFGVKFDYWYSQRELRKSGKIKKVLAFLQQKGFIYEQEDAVWFKSTQFGDDKDRVVVKSDGTYTYLAPDIAYHKDKFKRGFSWLINLWGPDHHGYISRLKAAVKALGKDAESLSVIIVQLASIFREGKPVQMSTRRGEYITLRDVLDEVGLDASRFFFLMRRTSSHLDFDLDIAKKQTPENPVYYVQYAHARICSILRNAKEVAKKENLQSDFKIKFKNLNLEVLKEKEELELLKRLWRFSYVLNICFKTLDPYPLTVYLQELSSDFHRFYDRHRVLGQAENVTVARLALLEGARVVIATALDLLGISKPEKM